MTEQEFVAFYDQACVAAGRIPVADVRIPIQLMLQMIVKVRNDIALMKAAQKDG